MKIYKLQSSLNCLKIIIIDYEFTYKCIKLPVFSMIRENFKSFVALLNVASVLFLDYIFKNKKIFNKN